MLAGKYSNTKQYFSQYSKENIPSKNSSWWSHKDVLHFRLQKTSWSRRIFSPYSYVFKMSTRHFDQDKYIRLGDTSSRRLQDVFKIPPRCFQDVLTRRLQDVLQKRLQDIFKTSWGCFEDVLKKSWRHLLGKMSSRSIKDVLKTLSIRMVNLVFSTFLRRTAKSVIYRKICLGHTSDKVMVRVKNLQEWTLWVYQNF